MEQFLFGMVSRLDLLAFCCRLTHLFQVIVHQMVSSIICAIDKASEQLPLFGHTSLVREFETRAYCEA